VSPGVEVVEVVVLGGRGGNAGTEIFQQGGSGCQVTASLAVELGDEMTWVRGGSGSDTTFSTVEQPGGVGGAGARPGGAGGATSQTFSNNSTPGAGGGGATSLRLNDNELIIAAGGGGGVLATGGGSACFNGTPDGSQGFGTSPVAGGGISPELGGVAGLGNGGSSNPPPGTAGNSATGSPPGAGGTGGVGQFGGPGGGGGGGGVSGGGGGAGQNGQFGGGIGSGAAGLSSAPEAPNGVAAPKFTAGGPAEGSVALRTVEITTPSLPEGTTGSSYSASLNADFVEFVDGPSSIMSTVSPANGGTITWSFFFLSSPLPAGLTLNPSGSITGTPTVTGIENVILMASVLDDAGDVRARSVVDYDIVIAQGTPPTTAPEPEPTSTTAAAPTTTVPGGGSGTLPATGAAGVAPLVAAGIALAGSGLGLGVLARRRRR
jgi:LPXTG-motif cell wall-anchored protein